MKLHQFTYKQLSKRPRLHGLEHLLARRQRLAFFQAREGMDARELATLAFNAGLYSPATTINDIAATIRRMRERGDLR